MRNIHYISCLPGSGKTHTLLKIAKDNLKERRTTILALPTIKLIDEVAKRVPEAIALYSGNVGTSDNLDGSLRKIKLHLETVFTANIILITHAALLRLDHSLFEKCKERNIDILLDEVFDVIKDVKFYNLKYTLKQSDFFDSLFEQSDFFGNKSVQVLTLLDTAEAQKLKRSYMRKIDVSGSIDITASKELIRSVEDKTNTVVLVHLKNHKYAIATLFNYKNFTYFKNVIIASAFLEDTLLFHYLGKYYNLVEKNIKGMRDVARNFYLIHVYPIVSNISGYYSKNKRESCRISTTKGFEKNVRYRVNNGEFPNSVRSIHEYAEALLQNCFGGEKFLRICNNDDREEESNGDWISSKSHGLNKYDGYDSCVMLIALNHDAKNKAVREILFPEHDFQYEMTILTMLQSIFRTSARDPNSRSIKKVFVLNEFIAKLIVDALGGKPKIKFHRYYEKHKAILKSDYTIAKDGHFKNGKLKLTEEEQNERKKEINAKYHAKKKEADKDGHFKNGKPKLTEEEQRERRKEMNAKYYAKKKEAENED